MFTSQVGSLNGMLRDVSPERAVEIMKNLLGQCSADLDHRGRVDIQIDPNTSRNAPFAVVEDEVNPFFAGIGVANFTGYIDGSDLPDPLVRRGWAAVFRGPVNIRANRFDNRRIALVVHNGVWADDGYYDNLYDHNGNPYYAVSARWAKAQSDSVDGSPDSVTCKFCDDALGNNDAGDNIIVILPERAGVRHRVATDDVIAVAKADDDTYVCVSDYSDAEGIPIIRFQLTASLSPGGSADALKVEWNGAAYATTGSTITVRDFTAPGRWRGASGVQGIAVWRADRADWEIVWMEMLAEFVSVTLAERMSGTTAGQSNSAAVDAYWNGENPGSTVTAYDTSNLFKYLSSGQKAICQYDYTNNKYRVIANATTFWCKAQHQWSTSGYVEVKLLAGYGGAEVGSAFNAYFTDNLGTAIPPKPGHKCPNVYKGMTVLCTVDDAGRVVVIDPNAYDDPIGTVKFQMLDPQAAGYLLLESGTISVGDADGGTFTLTFNGQTTSAIAWNADAATVQAALEALSNLAPGDISVSGSGEWNYSFGGTIDPVQPPMVFNGGGLTFPGGSDDAGGVSGVNISGWGSQNGIWNSAADYGGSGRDWETHDGSLTPHAEFPPVYLVPSMNTPTNAMLPVADSLLAHTHTVTIDNASATGTIGDHPPHVHEVGTHCGVKDFATAADLSGYLIISLTDSHGVSNGLFYTGREKVHEAGHSSDHADVTLSHTFTPTAHTHTNSVSSLYAKPHYKTMIPLERVNNSTESLGGV